MHIFLYKWDFQKKKKILKPAGGMFFYNVRTNLSVCESTFFFKNEIFKTTQIISKACFL